MDGETRRLQKRSLLRLGDDTAVVVSEFATVESKESYGADETRPSSRAPM